MICKNVRNHRKIKSNLRLRPGGYGVSTQQEVVPLECEAEKLTCFVALLSFLGQFSMRLSLPLSYFLLHPLVLYFSIELTHRIQREMT